MRSSLFITAMVLVLASCAGQELENRFIKASDSKDGLYEFNVDIQDTLSLYDFAFYTRVDDMSLRSKYGSVQMDVRWMSPSSRRALEEDVYIGKGDLSGIFAPYRSGVRLSESGVWTLYVRPVHPPKGFRGIGLTVKKNGSR